jgi:predicted class III extradiol MEMO1 family dioxygenase
MTTGQQESLYMIYVNVNNALIYSSDLCDDESLSAEARRSVKVIRDKLKWIKIAMKLKTDSKLLEDIDTLRYDELFRLLSELDVEHQDAIEKLIFNYVNNIK